MSTILDLGGFIGKGLLPMQYDFLSPKFLFQTFFNGTFIFTSFFSAKSISREKKSRMEDSDFSFLLCD